MLKILFIMMVLSFSATAGSSQKIAECYKCHDNKADSKAPYIDGQLKQYFAKQLKDYRKGSRKHEEMQEISEKLTDREIKDLAEYFSNLKWGHWN